MSTKEIFDKLVKEYNGKRVVYSKSGSRSGWRGKVAKIDYPSLRVTIAYDNGVIQDYHHSAIDGDERYLTVTSVPMPAAPVAPAQFVPTTNEVMSDERHRPYLVANMSGRVLESFDTEESAVSFASEQVLDAKGFIKLHIFKSVLTVQPKRVKVIVEKVNASEE